jgi:cytochrome c553
MAHLELRKWQFPCDQFRCHADSLLHDTKQMNRRGSQTVQEKNTEVDSRRRRDPAHRRQAIKPDTIFAMKTKKLVTYSIGLTAAALLMIPSSGRAADVQQNWMKNCAACHGKDGKGETKAGRKAGSKDMTDPKYQAQITDEKAIEAIKHGIKKDGKDAMKPFGEKLTDDEIKALVAKVRSFKK